MNTEAAKFDFEILHSIGRGAYGEVYLARDGNGVYRAVKVIFRDTFDDDRPFEREFEGLQKFQVISRSYDNQVQVIYVGRREEPKQFFYVMELADDQNTGQNINPDAYTPKTLRSELKRRGRLPSKECLGISMGLARALESLHENGLIHRDIKPANIIFIENRPKLADIGLVTDAGVSVSHVGTDGFIPPEGPSSPQADIYSLGKVLYEMCTGRDRTDFPELPTNLYELPDREMLLELNAVIAKACEHDPRKRYQNARELCDDLLCIQRGSSVRRQRIVQRRLAITAKICAFLAFLGIVAFGLLHVLKTPPLSLQEQASVRLLPQPLPANSATSLVLAHYLILVADDFVVDVYHNGERVPDSNRQLIREVYGATSERTHIEVRQGDWLVFNVVNDRLRWDGNYYFAVAGVLSTNEFGFVSELQSGNWSACDDLGKVPRFIAEKDYLTNNMALPLDREWPDGTKIMKELAGKDWSGEPVWGQGQKRNTWIKVIIK